MTKMKMLLVLMVAIVMIGTANAGSQLTVDDIDKEVPVGGSVSFTLTLNTSDSGTGRFDWFTLPIDPVISTDIDGDTDGSISFSNTPNVDQTFTLTVTAGDGATVGNTYETTVEYYGGTPVRLKAMVTAGTPVIPEANTAILTSAGIIGLIGLITIRRRRS